MIKKSGKKFLGHPVNKSFSKSPENNPLVTAIQMKENGIVIISINYQPSEGTIIEGLKEMSSPNMAFSSENMETLGQDLQFGLTSGMPGFSLKTILSQLHLS